MKEPKIRFKGFKGEWVETPLLDVVTLYNGLTYTPNDIRDHGTLVLRSSNVQEGEISLFDNVYVRSEVATSPNVKKGDIIVVVRNGSRTLIGKHAQIKSDMPNTVIGAFMAGIHTDEPEFLNALLCTRRFDNEVTINLGATINQITNGTFHSMKFLFPDKKEQKALASYFQHLDALIQSTTKKIESLKQVKAASLQSMFPQEGETTPRVRFKGFEGEWSICPLKYFAKKSTEKNISMDYTITLTNSAEYGVINQRDFFDHDISNDDHINGYFVIHHDDFVYNPRVSTAAPVGPINRNLLGYSGVMSPLYLIFRVNGINKDFLSYYFKTTLWYNYMKLEGNTGARFDRLSISDEQFFSMPICVPRDEKEQTVIASYFTNLDRQITLHTQRLEKLKQIKAACLDNMFV